MRGQGDARVNTELGGPTSTRAFADAACSGVVSAGKSALRELKKPIVQSCRGGRREEMIVGGQEAGRSHRAPSFHSTHPPRKPARISPHVLSPAFFTMGSSVPFAGLGPKLKVVYAQALKAGAVHFIESEVEEADEDGIPVSIARVGT